MEQSTDILNTKSKIKRLLLDVRFWIVFFFLLRLYGITDAPLEVEHSWRQSLTNMIARNFVDNSPDLLHPTIDMAGNQSGIIGSEFPFFNYLIYLFSYVFGYEHWYGRLINLFVTSIGVFYFAKLIKSLFGNRTALFSAIVLSASIWFAFARKTMPDTFSVAFVIIGLYWAYEYLRLGGWRRLILFFLLCTIGMLCKIPALSLFSVLLIVPFLKNIDLRRRLRFSFTSFLSFLIVCLWYFYWVPKLLEEHQFQLYFPKGIMEGLKEIFMYIPDLIEQFYFNSLLSFVGFAACLVGVFLFLKNEERRIKLGLGVIVVVFCAFIIKTGAVFPTHSYYIIPFTPIMAVFVGYLMSRIPMKWAIIVTTFIVVEAIGNQQHDFFIKDREMYKLTLEDKIESVVPNNELIIINGGSSPQHIYFAHRKGWTLTTEELNGEVVDSLTKLGASYLVLDITYGDLNYPWYTTVYSDKFYKIYVLKEL